MATSVNFLFLPYGKREPETAFFTEHLLMNASKKQQQFKSRFDKLFEKRSSHRRCSTKKGFLKISQYSHNIPVWSLFLIRLQALRQRCFPVNISKFSRARILKNICEHLLFEKILEKTLFFIADFRSADSLKKSPSQLFIEDFVHISRITFF